MKRIFFLLSIGICCYACNISQGQKVSLNSKNELSFDASLQKHLNAVMQKDYETLVTTLPAASERMLLILPGGAKTETAGDFLEGHKAWFAQENPWTLDMKIVHSEHGESYGMALVDATYHEPDREGKPYTNQIDVTYVMKKIEGKWLVIKDHASKKAAIK